MHGDISAEAESVGCHRSINSAPDWYLRGRRASMIFRLRAFFDRVKSQTHMAARGLTPASFFSAGKEKKNHTQKKNIGTFCKEPSECALRRSCLAHISQAPPV